VQHDVYRVEPGALRVNGIDLDQHHAHAWEATRVESELLEFVNTNNLSGAILGGHNLGFDLGFLRNFSPTFVNSFDYHTIDTQVLATALKQANVITSRVQN
jgi:DNA polymerase-3 subunit epsilon/ribonuclease T